MIESIFLLSLVVRYLELSGIVFSVAQPEKRIWPPPSKKTWKFYMTWILFHAGVVLTVIMVLLTWNTWVFSVEIRLFIGLPLILLGGAFVSWAIVSLGIINTHGINNGFIENGPYQFTRNPQYLGDIVLFIGLSIFVNSMYVTISLLLLAIVFLIAPFAEEQWLKEQYGDEYVEYKHRTPRFL